VDEEEAALRLSAQDFYIHQTNAEMEVSFTNAKGTSMAGNGGNANCGPSSLAMAFRLEGLELPAIPGVTHNGTDGADVLAARFAMYGIYDGASLPENDTQAANHDPALRQVTSTGTGG
jgi:hypothetical protein